MKRRDFIKNLGCGAMGSTTLFSTLASLGSLNGALANSKFADTDSSDYKAIVCILLSGGLDSYNLLIPAGTGGADNGFNEYLGLRTDLAVQNAGSLQHFTNPLHVGVRGKSSAYQAFGAHPGMPEVSQLFNSGKLAFMANIGTLVEPLNSITDYQNNEKKKPLGIYSHSDQQMQWQTSVPQSRDAIGVGGRLADLLHACNDNEELSMNISLAGKNLFQRGTDYAEYAISDNINANNVGFEALPSGWSNSGLLTELRNGAIDNMVSETYSNLLQKTFATTTRQSIAAFDSFKEALKKVPSFTTTFPNNNSLADDLFAISRVMSVRNELGAKRQIFFVDFGGWDMHDNLVSGLNERLPMVSAALKAFYDSTVELGISDKVTTFTISDFARTITSNGQGSDHGWGGNTMVMGGAVNGGKIYGAFPQMDIFTNPVNVSFRGNFIPAVSTDELYAELALWYGVSPADLCYALPNLGNFYSFSANNYPLGLMNMTGGVSAIDRPQNCLVY